MLAKVVDRFATPQFVISLMLVILFSVAYLKHPDDGTLNGAIIAAFSAAWGYFIGSASHKSQDVAKKVEVTNTDDNAIPVKDG